MSVKKLTLCAKQLLQEIITEEEGDLPRYRLPNNVGELKAFLLEQEIWEQSDNQPVDFPMYGWFLEQLTGRWGMEPPSDSDWYLYKDAIYQVTGVLSNEQKTLLVIDAFDAERRKFERIKSKQASVIPPGGFKREKIPEEVRIYVWQRDGGKCVKCSSRENLEYDHIIPVSKGGSNTARNIELLCEKCNREKSSDIGNPSSGSSLFGGSD